MRLDRFLAESAALTRSEARRAIQRGEVRVGGDVCRKADAQVDENAAATLRGQALARETFVYVMLDKPAGVVSASEDAHCTTVADLVRGAYPRRQLFPAGRLDKTSTGFVLLTDDGALAHALLAPRRHVPKTYTVVLDTPLTPAMEAGFAAGVCLADGSRMRPAGVRACSADGLTVEVELRQGVYHQIKRMFGVYGAGVNALRRTAIGPVALDAALGAGGYRALTAAELAALRAAAAACPDADGTEADGTETDTPETAENAQDVGSAARAGETDALV